MKYIQKKCKNHKTKPGRIKNQSYYSTNLF